MNKKIVVCDDDKEILEMISIILADADLDVVTEINSLNLLGVIEEEDPNLLLLDLWMPVLTGDQVLRELRKKQKKLPVIVMSASRDGEEIAKNAGASAYIAKPFDIDLLIELVNKLIR